MWWECSECGENVERLCAPDVCPGCAVAGAIFVAAGDDTESEPGWKRLRQLWMHRALASALLRQPELT